MWSCARPPRRQPHDGMPPRDLSIPVLPKMTPEAELCNEFWDMFGGPANLLNQESSSEEIQKLLAETINSNDHVGWKHKKAIENALASGLFSRKAEEQDVLNLVENFVEEGVYTSRRFMKQRFPRDFDILDAKLNLEFGTWPDSDFPIDCQVTLLERLQLIVEKQFDEFINKNKLQEWDDIDGSQGFELSISKILKLLDNECCLSVLKQKSPGYAYWKFRKLMDDVAAMRKYRGLHKMKKSTAYLCQAVQSTLNVVRMFSEGVSVYEAPLLILRDDMAGWMAWSERDKAQSRAELRKIFDQVLGEHEASSNRREKEILENEKKIWAMKIVAKREVDREELGRKFSQHLNDMFGISDISGGISRYFCEFFQRPRSTTRFFYPAARVPLRR